MNPGDAPTLPESEASEARPFRLGHFEIVERLGAGGMGMVFEGRDTVLGRRVALKLLHPARAGGTIAPARLLREAQALAKLSHPNVVTVFEVGMAGDDPFVAMELVEGETLLTWMAKPRTWRDVLDVFIAVGHGLAAVHALGLVHRDFKPSNVLIDRNGVPKLGDFGLVTTIDEPISSDGIDDSPDDPSLTKSGMVLGTPAYMAPEQKVGRVVDPRADQYSFAKSLMEALPDAAPAALQPILARALSDDPAARYPDMAGLLDALARIRRGNRARWIAAGASVAIVGAVAVAWGFGRAQQASEVCARPLDRLATAWGPLRRAALESHLIVVDPSLGIQRFTVAAGVLDRGGERWLDQRVDTCKAARTNQQSGELLDRRMSCLDRALVELGETATVLERTINPSTLDGAMKAIALPTLDDCADTTALLELVPRPTNPMQRAEADALAKQIVEINVAFRSGGVKDSKLPARAADIVDRARKLGDAETLARALQSLVNIQSELGDYAALEVTAREAITQAATAHDDRLVTELWTLLLRMLGTEHKVEDARMLLPAAEAALARTSTTTELVAKFLDAKALILTIGGDGEHALASITSAVQLLEVAGARSPSSPLYSILITVKGRRATTYVVNGRFDDAIREFRETIALATKEYGDDHPATAILHFNLAIALRRKPDVAAALAEFREAARIAEARLIPSPNLAEYIYAVGNTLVAMEKQEEAIPVLVRAVAMDRATLPPGDVRLADVISPLAAAYVDTRRYDQAKPLLDETIAILEAHGNKTVGGMARDKLAIAYSNRGEWASQTHHCATGGLADLDRAIAMYQDLKQTDDIIGAQIMRGECLLDTRLWSDALALSATLLADKEVVDDPRAAALFIHGQALWNLGRHAQGIGEVRAAHDGLVKAGGDAKVIQASTEWLAAHGS